jgi:hypothetical protein
VCGGGGGGGGVGGGGGGWGGGGGGGGGGGRGTRSRCFNSGYHGPGLLQVDFSLVVYLHKQLCNIQNSLLTSIKFMAS